MVSVGFDLGGGFTFDLAEGKVRVGACHQDYGMYKTYTIDEFKDVLERVVCGNPTNISNYQAIDNYLVERIRHYQNMVPVIKPILMELISIRSNLPVICRGKP